MAGYLQAHIGWQPFGLNGRDVGADDLGLGMVVAEVAFGVMVLVLAQNNIEHGQG